MFSILILLATFAIEILSEDAPSYDPTDPSHVVESESKDEDQVPGLGGPSIDEKNLNPGGLRRGGMMADGMSNRSVESLLEARCGQCHGPRKQKAGVQVVPVETMFVGPQKDWVVIPGQPDQSSLIERIILPAGHDDVMPPDGEPLTESQVRQVKDWIRGGADVAAAREGAPMSMNQGRRSQGNREPRPRVWFEIYMSLDLTTEQRIAATKATRTLQRETRAFQRTWGSQLQELQKQVNQLGREQNPDAVKLREQLQVIRSKQPDVASVQESLWEALDSEQQVAMRAALDQSQKDRRRSERDRSKESANALPERGRALDEETRRRLRFLLDERRKADEKRSGNDSKSD